MDEEKLEHVKEAVSVSTPSGYVIEMISSSKNADELCNYVLGLLKEIQGLNGNKTGGSYTG